MRNSSTGTVKKRVIKALRFCAVLLLIIVPITVSKVYAEPSTSNEERSRIIVSLGDSYASGEGIEPFYYQDYPVSKKVQEQDWLAHRSKKSWSGRLTLSGVRGTMAENRGTNWFFAASSGATTYHLTHTQRKEYDIKGVSGSKYIDKQLDIFKKLGDQKAEYVTVSIGGNDAQFSNVIVTAALPHPFNPGALSDKLTDIWSEFYYGVDGDASIRERLRQAYSDIQDAAGNQAKIIIVGYPKLITKNGNIFFSKSDAELINSSVSQFNKEIKAIVQSCKTEGMKICFVSVEEAFDGHEAYSKDAYIKKVCITRNSEDLSGPPSAYSMHPNDQGAKVYASCVQAKIDEIEADNGKSEWPEMVSSDERDIVLALDVSGSMSGKPIEETQKAAEKFISTILKEDASIGIVTYDSSSMCIADFCMNEKYLINTVHNINAGGGTNMEDGLAKSYAMLQNSNAKKKIIVLMSDGSPNEGKVGDELIEYAKTIKDEGIYIYTLGFFSRLYNKTAPQALLESIASDGCHFEVENADDLVYFFGDIADQINGQKYIYVRIACPVDVTVEHDGETLCSEEDNLSTRTAFGSLTFEDNAEESETNGDNRVKVLRLKEGIDYDIKIEGNGRGYMNYTIGFMDDTGEYSDLRRFNNIKITKRTVIDTVATPSKATILKVDEDGDGKYDLTYKATENGRGEIVDYTYIIYIAIGAVAVVIILIVTVIIKKRLKLKKS